MARTPFWWEAPEPDLGLQARPAVVKLEAALGQYVSTLEHLASIRPCLETWPGDPAGPGYVGTRCQLLEGHAQQKGTQHRHRVLGSQVTLEWP